MEYLVGLGVASIGSDYPTACELERKGLNWPRS